MTMQSCKIKWPLFHRDWGQIQDKNCNITICVVSLSSNGLFNRLSTSLKITIFDHNKSLSSCCALCNTNNSEFMNTTANVNEGKMVEVGKLFNSKKYQSPINVTCGPTKCLKLLILFTLSDNALVTLHLTDHLSFLHFTHNRNPQVRNGCWVKFNILCTLLFLNYILSFAVSCYNSYFPLEKLNTL